jgi:hypothetical protein
MKRMIWLVVMAGAGAGAAGCTTLGPMPTTTGIAAVPNGRPGIEAQVGLVPGYFLSEATQAPTHHTDPIGQVLGLVEPDRWLGTRGLVLGARRWGPGGDHGVEPVVGYRHPLDDSFALAVFGYGTRMSAANEGAAYRATRVGGELAVDARMISLSRWIAIHGQAAVSTMYLNAHGSYCVDSVGAGTDCNHEDGDHLINGSIHGAFTTATATLALDLARRPDGVLHSFRVAVLGAAGVMPQIRDGAETAGTRYVSLGLTLTVGLGARDRQPVSPATTAEDPRPRAPR